LALAPWRERRLLKAAELMLGALGHEPEVDEDAPPARVSFASSKQLRERHLETAIAALLSEKETVTSQRRAVELLKDAEDVAKTKDDAAEGSSGPFQGQGEQEQDFALRHRPAPKDRAAEKERSFPGAEVQDVARQPLGRDSLVEALLETDASLRAENAELRKEAAMETVALQPSPRQRQRTSDDNGRTDRSAQNFADDSAENLESKEVVADTVDEDAGNAHNDFGADDMNAAPYQDRSNYARSLASAKRLHGLATNLDRRVRHDLPSSALQMMESSDQYGSTVRQAERAMQKLERGTETLRKSAYKTHEALGKELELAFKHALRRRLASTGAFDTRTASIEDDAAEVTGETGGQRHDGLRLEGETGAAEDDDSYGLP
jgi:hypothetical protein